MNRYVIALLGGLFLASNSFGDVVLYDSHGFESPTFTAGQSPVGQDASNPWQAFGGSPAAYTVETSNTASGSQALQGNGGGLNDGSYVWPNLGYTPPDDVRVRIQVDMARTLSATVSDSSPVYAIDIYDFDFNRTSRFGLQNPTGTSDIRTFISVPINAQGEIDPAGTGIRSEYYGPAVAENQFVHFDFLMDYATKTVSMSVDGARVASLVPFHAQESTTLDSAELQVGTFPAATDNGWFDNYTVTAQLKGDYNHDNVVDMADYVVWRNSLGSTTALDADGDGDGSIGQSDYDVWRGHFGKTLSPPAGAAVGSSSAVPEPSSFLMAAMVCGAFIARRGRKG